MNDTLHCKIVTVGDGGVGKTCLLSVYTSNEFPEEYVPTVFDNYTEQKEFNIGNSMKSVRLDLWDTAGQEEFDRIRPLSYRDANYFIIAFSVLSPESFLHVQRKWIPEIKHHAPHKSFLLVGLKSDLRECEISVEKLAMDGESPVSAKAVQTFADEIGADGYVECSAKLQTNVDLVFETALNKYFKPKKKKSKNYKKCLIM